MVLDSPASSCDQASASNSPLAAQLAGLADLVQALPGGAAPAERLRAAAEQVDASLIEHEGMANELITLYEQMGVLFDITRRLGEADGEAPIVQLFERRIGQSLPGRQVVTLWPAPAGEGWLLHGQPVTLPKWVAGRVDEARSAQRVQVYPVAGPVFDQPAVELMVGPVFAGDEFVCALLLTRPDGVLEFRACDMNLIGALLAFCGDLISNQRLIEQLQEASIAMVRTLVTTVDQKDAYTCGHSVRVGYFARLLGERLGLGASDLQMLEWGALLHDIGKIGIRDDVLKKQGKLTKEEFDHMKEHPARSYRVVRAVPQLEGAVLGVLHHHEHYDGGGYPDGLAGEDIPLQARIIQIADVFDALTSTRSYRKAFGWEKALEIMQDEAGRTVDPNLQRLFETLIREQLASGPDAWLALMARAEAYGALDNEDCFEGQGA